MFKLRDIYRQTDHKIGERTIRQLLLAFLLLLVPFAAFCYIADQVHEGETLAFDTKVLLGIYHRSTPVLDQIMLFTTNLGGVLAVIILTAIAAGIYAWKRRWQAVAQILAGVGGAAVLNMLLKLLFARNRPDLWHQLIVETSYSFPSGHAMLSSALAFSLVVVLWHTKLRWLAFSLATLFIIGIGFTRLYLGVHYPTDVVAGWCVSAAWVLTVAFVLGSIKFTKRSKKA